MRHALLWILLAFPATVFADGYVFRDGYYWLGSVPYTRTQSKVWTSHCNYYLKNSYAKADYKPPAVYVPPKVEIPYTPPATYIPPTPSKGWRDKLLELKEAQLAFEQKQKDAERDHKEYLEAIDALGLGGSLEPSYSGYKLSKLQSVYGNASQGNTVYGYSLSSVADVYGQNDVSVWMQQYGRAQAAAQTSAERGLDGMLQAINLEGDNRARVATIIAKAQLLQSLDVPETKTQTTLEVQQSSTGGQAPVVDALAQSTSADLGAMLSQRCYNCHSPDGASGVSGKSELFPQGVDLTHYGEFSVAQKRRVVESVLSGEMPKNSNGLSVEETGLLYADLLNSVRAQPAKKD